MDKAVLLTKLNNCNDKTFELYDYYLNATSKSFSDASEEFNVCIKNIKTLTDNQYDFSWLSENSERFGVNRREYKSLCDDVCSLLGNRIQELCCHTRDYIIVKPSNYEDYCPFSRESLVAYGNPNIIKRNGFNYDGKTHNIICSKIEESPYYTIFCSTFDL